MTKRRRNALFLLGVLASAASTLRVITIASTQHMNFAADHVFSWHPKAVRGPAKKVDSFSACLLIMDDNHRLVEWLAYHWFLLPLRYLVLAVDPNSRTSPKSILDQWRKMGMTIVEWSDNDFWTNTTWPSPTVESAVYGEANKAKLTRQYLTRQNVFIKQCMLHMKTNGKKWVTFHDVDEYLGYNHPSGTEAFEEWELERNNITKQRPRKFRQAVRMIPSLPPPLLNKAGSFLPFLERERGNNRSQLELPCVTIPRIQFGAIESAEEEISKGVNPKLDPKRFDTMRWRYHADRDDFDKNGISKVFIDISRLSVGEIEADINITRKRRPYNPHRPLFRHCKETKVYDHNSIFRINHYLGSWEAFSFRDDPRKGAKRTSRDGWEFLSQSATKGPSDWLRPWLQGFVDVVGTRRAVELLKDSGFPRDYTPTPRNVSWAFDGIRNTPRKSKSEWQAFIEGKNKTR
jgi:hypothetical protein